MTLEQRKQMLDSLKTGAMDTIIQDKTDKKMWTAKLAATLATALNIFIYTLAFIANLDTIKSTILFILAVAMSMYRFYRWAINSWQNKVLKDLEIRRKELEILKTENDESERRALLIEKELSLRITGLTPEQRRNNK